MRILFLPGYDIGIGIYPTGPGKTIEETDELFHITEYPLLRGMMLFVVRVKEAKVHHLGKSREESTIALALDHLESIAFEK
jgi:hypothetical protein